MAKKQFNDIDAINNLGEHALLVLQSAKAATHAIEDAGTKAFKLATDIALYKNAVNGLVLANRAPSVKSQAFTNTDLLILNDVVEPTVEMLVKSLQSSGLSLLPGLSLFPWVHIEHSANFCESNPEARLRKALVAVLEKAGAATHWKGEITHV